MNIKESLRDSIRIEKEREELFKLFYNRNKKEQSIAIRDELYAINSKLVIAHEDIWMQLISAKYMSKNTMNYLIKSPIILMTERTRLNIIRKLTGLIEDHNKILNRNIASDLKLLVVPDDKLNKLEEYRQIVEIGVRTILIAEYKGKIHTNEEIDQVIEDNYDLIDGAATAMAYGNTGTKFITEQRNSLLLNTTRIRSLPTVMDFVNSDIVDIQPLLDNIMEINAKSLYLAELYADRKNNMVDIRENQDYFRRLIERKDPIIMKCIEIDRSIRRIPRDDIPTGSQEQDPRVIERIRRNTLIGGDGRG